MSSTFPAVVIEEVDGKAVTAFKQLSLADLPDHDTLVEIQYSGLNYKDGLALSGNRNKVARSLPMVGGIDLVGRVVECSTGQWQPGDAVVLNGFGLSELHWGGFSRFQRVKAEWLVPLPSAFLPLQAMAIGTAGYTAALCVDALEQWGHIQPGRGKVLVTGAAGGVGSVAVALLAKAGYHVVASTGRADTHDYLQGLGAAECIDRATLQGAVRPLQRESWAGAVDSVGSTTLANVLAQVEYGGAVAACGLAGGMDLPGTVLPHILRSVALLGVDSVMAPIPQRLKAWDRLARDLPADKLDADHRGAHDRPAPAGRSHPGRQGARPRRHRREPLTTARLPGLRRRQPPISLECCPPRSRLEGRKARMVQPLVVAARGQAMPAPVAGGPHAEACKRHKAHHAACSARKTKKQKPPQVGSTQPKEIDVVTNPMKKNGLALAALLCTAGAAQAQSNVAIYGILDASFSHAKAVYSKTALRSGDLLAPRLGFRGTEDVGSGLKAHFALEAGLAHDTGTGSAGNTNNQASGAMAAGPLVFNRQSWVGLENSWGELRLGRNFNPTYRQYIVYDPFMGGGVGASQAAQSSLATYGYSPAGLRHSNAIEYWLPSKGALTGQFMYALGENPSNAANASDGKYLAGRLAYQMGDANVGFAGGKMRNAAKGDIDEYVLGGRYKLGDAVLMGMYTRTSDGLGNKQDGWLLGGTLRQQAMEYRLALSTSKLKNASGASAGTTHKLAAIGRYHLSRRSSVYLMGVLTRNSDGASMVPLGALGASETTPNQSARAISVGLTHTF